MKARTLLAAFTLAVTAACSADALTDARAPERASFDGGSIGPGHRTLESAPSNPPPDTTADNRGGSYGPGH